VTLLDICKLSCIVSEVHEVLSVTADDENKPSVRYDQVDVLYSRVLVSISVRCSTTAGSIYDTILVARYALYFHPLPPLCVYVNLILCSPILP
jgi:hypothetical protein